MAGELTGKVAIVTGASRGVGKGIAEGLGEAGATVYITGRTMTTGSVPLPGSVSETAELVSSLGGIGIAVQCDHRDDEQVKLVFDQVKRETGRLDILVNNATGQVQSGQPFWQMPLSVWDSVIEVGLRSNYVATVFAAPMMIEKGAGLIVNVSSRGAGGYLFTPAYGVGKAAVDRLTADTAHELRPHNVCVVSLWPGFVRTEAVVADADRLKAEYRMNLDRSQSPRFSDRAVAALAEDAQVMNRSGAALTVSELASAYGFQDLPADTR